MATLPVWKADSAGSTGAAAVNVPWPTGHASGDFGLLIVNSSNEAVSTPAGWTAISTNNGTGTGTAATADSVALHVFWRFATSGAEANAALADSGNHTTGTIITFTGVDTTDPLETNAVTTKSTNSTSDTFPAITTAGDNRLVVAIIAGGQESTYSAWTFAGLDSFTARAHYEATSGVDGSIAAASGGKAAAGSTGTGSVTASISTKAITMTVALKPADASSGGTGTLAVTLADASLSATGTLPIVGTLSGTLADSTLSSAGALSIKGTLSQTLADATLSSAGALPLKGTMAATLADATLSAFGEPTPVLATLAVTLADSTLAATGALPIKGTLAATLADATAASAGVLPIAATSSATLADATLSSTGILSIVGSAAITLAEATLASLSTLAISATLAVTLASATSAGAGALPIVGTLSVTLEDSTLSSAGGLAPPIAGTLAGTLADATLSATAALPIAATLGVTLADATASATAHFDPLTGQLAVTLADATLAAEIWGAAYTPVAGDRTPIPANLKFTEIENWNGIAKATATLVNHAAAGEHHVSVILSSPSATGVLRIRMVPTDMTVAVALDDETEAIDIAVSGSTSFVVSGFYSAIEARFTTALSAGTVTITVVSDVESGSPAPPTTAITTTWNGSGVASKSMPSHAAFSTHHITVACTTMPTAGSVVISGRPTGSAGGRTVLAGPYYLTGTGTVNVVISGFYDEFSISPVAAIVGATAIEARVASVFGMPLLA